jgi:hypothetical protein
MNVVFQRLGFAIQKRFTAQLVVRLPFININYLIFIYIKYIIILAKTKVNVL